MSIFDKTDGHGGPEPDTEARLRSIEAKLDAVMAHLGIGTGPSDAVPPGALPVPGGFSALDPRGMPEVMDWVHREKLIQAIKSYRTITGVGLREAKEAVDSVAWEVRQRRR
ncbi:hypothetical protein ABIA33_001566 [Streptacidiphilus sp. MAP12-16]|uniref:ribosomal protein L7/L12 n=1 Tax=Streptacidiphilus sp. MAP12-16 TaxID=3156300 RepID=UPI003517FDBC